ncbi:hypothetical protein [Enterovirga sp. CN4-39]|uniref:hypothetical protein n=1 Tax=Enterovirga sp. CN4-39 TaxID=3400910 RepID=UPI003BFCA31B
MNIQTPRSFLSATALTPISEALRSTPDDLRAKATVLRDLLQVDPSRPPADDREALAASIVNDILRDGPNAQPDPIFDLIDECWRAFDRYDEAARTDDDAEAPATRHASEEYWAAWRAVLAFRPTTPEGVRALAQCALTFSDKMGSDDYRDEVLQALARSSVAELVAEAKAAEQAMVAASEAIDQYELGRAPTEAEKAAFERAYQAELRAFRAAVSAKPQSAEDVRLQVELIKSRYEASVADPGEGLFAFLDSIQAYVSELKSVEEAQP